MALPKQLIANRIFGLVLLISGIFGHADHCDALLQTDTRLRAELAKRVTIDQAARNAWIKYMQSHPNKKSNANDLPEVLKRMKKVDAENLAWIKKVVGDRGWPGKSKV